VNIKEIKEMISLMNDNGLVELEIEKDGMRIRLKKTTAGVEGMPGPFIVEKQVLAGAPGKTAPEQFQAEPVATRAMEIKAPMVGTFYRASSPEASPYVEAGQVIEPGQVICIIEAMKLMNEIKSDVKAKILEVLVDNAEPVEFGQPMFLVEPV
jgi:acetyl-CoA carboxylase biotin carboxyl carrier protein